ncbi:hypothetical protein BDZ94DRAFT_1319097 [Collybia nuda]|uniref:F-box domain-containing protein n=1 Tax=Collybia nuda TaxID=64659 RepID=A0A9P5YDN0_9AGAR|nr:hypothetical protein BDZ94DRAFT_1319097 [Collybia nuda]
MHVPLNRMPPLPQELVNMIIHHLQLPTDYNTLLACCLVCRAFLPAALSKLHFAAYIEKRNVRRASERLTPNVAQYICEVYLHSSHENSSWLSDGPLVVILRQLLHLQKVRLHHCTWSALSSDLRAEIIRIFQGQRFRHVQIFGVEGLPLTLFESFTNLRHLDISSISLQTPSQGPQFTPPIIPIDRSLIGRAGPAKIPIHLESLGLAVLSGELPSVSVEVQKKDMISVLDFLLNPSTSLDVTRLSTISFDTEPLSKEFEHGLGRLLDACCTSVGHVKMYSPVYANYESFKSTSISFKRLCCLKSLVILVSHIQNGVMRWLARILGTFEPLNAIEKIQIVFILHDDHHQVTYNEWKFLNSVFMLPGSTSLSRLIVEWSIFPGALTLDEEHGFAFEDMVKSNLPYLSSRNILEVRKMQLSHNDLFSLDRNLVTPY